MAMTFSKMHGAGNDFVVLDLRRQSFGLDSDIARQIADRNTGVGCDQLLVLRSPGDSQAKVAFEVWNADGSRAEQCGNGVRCIGLLLAMNGEVGSEEFTIRGPVADISLRCLEVNGNTGRVSVNMGVPEFRPERIPVLMDAESGRYRLAVEDIELEFGAVSMGNPHVVIQVSDVDDAPVARLGAAVACHEAFPEGCNAGFAEVVDPGHIRLRVFERGAAETRACGSGACAAAAVLARQGVTDSKIVVDQAGGRLIIDWNRKAGTVHMTGPAVHVFEGKML